MKRLIDSDGTGRAIESVLVANRGEIARRVLRTVRRMGLRGISVYSETDGALPYVRESDRAVLLEGDSVSDTYLSVDGILAAARSSGADAIHPGYGFLSENADFARAVIDSGLIWIGPDPDVIEMMGDKVNARNVMARAGVPISRGTDSPVPDEDAALMAAGGIGYPVMVKAAGGGGGIGMSVAADDVSLVSAFKSAQSRAERFFGNGSVFLERYMGGARHVEVQILGLTDGRVLALGERDCSVQRRHQKVAEETPCPGIGDDLRRRMLDGAIRAGEAVGYRNAGTVECLVDPNSQDYVFLEMNTRLQVEHPITELVTGIDLVEQQLLISANLPISFNPIEAVPKGHAIEFRIYAEDHERFMPSPGAITTWQEPVGPGIRVDAGYSADTTVSPRYDSLLAKLCIFGPDRETVLRKAQQAVSGFTIEGPKTNLPFFKELLSDAGYVSGSYDTGIIARMRT